MFFKERRIKKFVRRVHSHTSSKAKYGAVINEFKSKKLYASAGYRVKNPRQAQAIARNMAYGVRSKKIKKEPKKTFFSKLKSVFRRKGHGK